MRVLLIVLSFCLTASLAFASSSRSLHDRLFDDWFQLYSHLYLPENDWRLLKAQCWQESRFDREAVSPVGAIGVCQFMPRTWEEVQRDLRFKASPYSSQMNIKAAAWYMRKMKRIWRSDRPDEPDRNNLALASYNAGAGNLIKAQKRCGGVASYDGIISCLSEVTGVHSKETITYVQRIRRWFKELVS